MTRAMTETVTHPIVDHDAWLAARVELLEREKAFTRARDELSAARRELPWERVEKPYRFDHADGARTLGELFEGRSQLIIYHFMYPADWDAGCKSCSFWADNFDPIIVHLNARDVTMVAVSIAPLELIEPYQRRMGWSFRWYSSATTDFNRDFGVSFTPEEAEHGGASYNYRVRPTGPTEREGMSVFYRDDAGDVYHTYSAYERGIDMFNTAYHYLDTVPKGRDEHGRNQYWLRRHDEYGD
jgi:predicted dithiol-disulfide oxidoreductase (DUF899 family)